MIIGMEWKGDGGSWWDVQWRCRAKTQCRNIVELCVHGDACWWNRNNCECFLFYVMNECTSKKEKTYLVLSLLFLSVLSSFLSSQYSLSFSFLLPKWSVFPFLFLPLTNISPPFFFLLILIDLFFLKYQ